MSEADLKKVRRAGEFDAVALSSIFTVSANRMLILAVLFERLSSVKAS